MTHKKSKHEEVKYPCDQCDFKANLKHKLFTHIKSNHEDVEYPCVTIKQN